MLELALVYYGNSDIFVLSYTKSYTHFHLRNIGRIKNILTFDATAQLIHDLITTRLYFCNSILCNLPNNKIKRLQNHAARLLKCIPLRSAAPLF